ncbi:hypothetical protein GOP47_0020657 [Adiantum capillus-veneris]|uniref:Uncharacterized protein n=1 Tax=Adiantum capillus-veneris TaxID=13818 RepID=A0A9D4UAD4_ADICA|nr:hypothetical protein GOP47_0020657 [Adiantum capillus-veneris]
MVAAFLRWWLRLLFGIFLAKQRAARMPFFLLPGNTSIISSNEVLPSGLFLAKQRTARMPFFYYLAILASSPPMKYCQVAYFSLQDSQNPYNIIKVMKAPDPPPSSHLASDLRTYEQALSEILWLYRSETGREDAELTTLLRLGAGACAIIIVVSTTYPMEMVQGRLTVQTEDSPMRYQGMFHAASTIMKEEGPLAVYKATKPEEYVDLSVLTKLGCGAAVGTVDQTIAYPLDVVRRRMQMVGWKGASSVITTDSQMKALIQYTGMIDAFLKTI